MGLNEDLIRDRFEDIQQSLERLEAFKALERDTFLQDSDILDIACYRLLVAIEAALQICFHICAQRLHQVPEEYAGCFAILGKAGILSEEQSLRLQQMARFRNMLVHVYWKVDYNQVYDILQFRLGDLHAFIQSVGALL